MVRFGKNLDVVLRSLFWKWLQILVVFRIFCCVWVWLGWLGKNWMCVWALTCKRKWLFDVHLFWLIVCVRRFFFLGCVGFRRCNLCCNLCMGWSMCLCERWFRCWSILWWLWGFYQLPKIYLKFQNKKSFHGPDTFDFKSLPAFLQQPYPLHHLIISPHMLLNRKLRKRSLSEEVRDEIKPNKISHV